MNLKKYYMSLLSNNSALTELLGDGKILSAYPQKVTVFPSVIFEDNDSSDIEFSDNLPNGTAAQVRIHVFSKTLKGYPKAETIAELIRSIFRANYWAMTNNTETPDVEDNIKHRILDFKREFYSL
ncbi:MAG: DUF3168 domain-containing protein [Methanobrevibacter sp.]|nr:DUF3168 domain-containing protein [Methanobrevibacter sp.]